MEIINLFIFLGFTYTLRFFNMYQIIFYFSLLSISLQLCLNENPQFISHVIESTEKIKFDFIEYSRSNFLLNSIIEILSKTNDLYVKGRDIIVNFLGRNFISTFAPKDIATIMLDENIHQMMNPVLINKPDKKQQILHVKKKEKVFDDDNEMYKFLDSLDDSKIKSN
jgi:hypothetical protein